MSDKDAAAESVEQDCLCIKCREAAERKREEEAVASFCATTHIAIAEWFTGIITHCGFAFESRYPADIDTPCEILKYKSGVFGLEMATNEYSLSGDFNITLYRNDSQNTSMNFYCFFNCPTPAPVILAAIKAANANL